MSELAQRWQLLCEKVSQAARRAGRVSGDIQVLPVSKGQSVELMQEALALPAFPRRFGENYDDELVEKVAAFPRDIEWHYQGRLQSRKIAKLAEVAQVFQTIARHKEIDLLAGLGGKPNGGFFIQVNVSAETQKNGCEASELPLLLEHIAKRGMAERIQGLMCLPSDLGGAAESDLRREFASLRGLRDKFLPGKRLSMGMSGDFEIAIEEGSDLVRIGSTLFGARKPIR